MPWGRSPVEGQCRLKKSRVSTRRGGRLKIGSGTHKSGVNIGKNSLKRNRHSKTSSTNELTLKSNFRVGLNWTKSCSCSLRCSEYITYIPKQTKIIDLVAVPGFRKVEPLLETVTTDSTLLWFRVTLGALGCSLDLAPRTVFKRLPALFKIWLTFLCLFHPY